MVIAFRINLLFALLAFSLAQDEYTLKDIEKHDSSSDCWSAVYDSVYDLTDYAPQHRWGGGARRVYQMCGIDSTDLYDDYHGDHPEWLDTFSSIKRMGDLVEEEEEEEETPAPTTPEPTTPEPTTPEPTTPEPTTPEPTTPEPTTPEPTTPEPTTPEPTTPEPTTLAPTTAVPSTSRPTIFVPNTRSPATAPAATTAKPTTQAPSVALPETNPPSTLQPSTLSPTTTAPTTSSPTTTAPTTPSPTTTAPTTQAPSTALPTTQAPTTVAPSTEAPSTFAPSTSKPTTEKEATVVTMDELARHNAPTDCWVAYYDVVYNLTDYDHPEPPGNSVIHMSCGEDGTAAYEPVHPVSYLRFVRRYIVGDLDSSTPATQEPAKDTKTPVPSTTQAPAVKVNSQDLAEHDTPSDCWVLYYDKVYNLSAYEHPDPPGNSVVHMSCGADGTEAYMSIHPRSLLTTVENYVVGIFVDDESGEPQDPENSTTTEPLPDTGGKDDEQELTIGAEELGRHSTPSDCWVAYYESVYNLTAYNHPDPPGNSVIHMSCGKDGTEPYASIHERSLLTTVEHFVVGSFEQEDEQDDIEQTPSESPQSENSLHVSIEELESHSTPEDCWVSYYGEVYDLTEYAPRHPTGPGVVVANCGEDGTAPYSVFHEQSLLELVKEYYVGLLSENATGPLPGLTTPTVIGEMTMEDVALHNKTEDCFVSYYGLVYDLTYYSHPSPPGQDVIYMACGEDGTSDYVSVHPQDLLRDVEEYKVGWLSSSSRFKASSILSLALLSFFLV